MDLTGSKKCRGIIITYKPASPVGLGMGFGSLLGRVAEPSGGLLLDYIYSNGSESDDPRLALTSSHRRVAF